MGGVRNARGKLLTIVRHFSDGDFALVKQLERVSAASAIPSAASLVDQVAAEPAVPAAAIPDDQVAVPPPEPEASDEGGADLRKRKWEIEMLELDTIRAKHQAATAAVFRGEVLEDLAAHSRLVGAYSALCPNGELDQPCREMFRGNILRMYEVFVSPLPHMLAGAGAPPPAADVDAGAPLPAASVDAGALVRETPCIVLSWPAGYSPASPRRHSPPPASLRVTSPTSPPDSPRAAVDFDALSKYPPFPPGSMAAALMAGNTDGTQLNYHLPYVPHVGSATYLPPFPHVDFSGVRLPRRKVGTWTNRG